VSVLLKKETGDNFRMRGGGGAQRALVKKEIKRMKKKGRLRVPREKEKSQKFNMISRGVIGTGRRKLIITRKKKKRTKGGGGGGGGRKEGKKAVWGVKIQYMTGKIVGQNQEGKKKTKEGGFRTMKRTGQRFKLRLIAHDWGRDRYENQGDAGLQGRKREGQKI